MNGDGNLDEPRYIISVAARLVDLHPQTLRHYESIGLVNPQRSDGNIRLYSERDIERVRRISRLMDELGVNLAGVEIILNMGERLEQLQHEMQTLQRQMDARLNAERSRIRDEMLQALEKHIHEHDPEWKDVIRDIESRT